MVNESNFLKNIDFFLHELSQHLRASIRISVDANGRLKIFKWSNTTYVENLPINLPNKFNFEKTNAIYEGEKQFKKNICK